MRILAVNWLDLENPQAGGAEVHVFELLGRLAESGHDVTMVVSGWRGAPRRTSLRGIDVRRVGGRHSFALRGRPAVRALLAGGGYDVVIEDINKLPLYLANVTPLPLYVIVPHLFGTTAFREASFPIAAAVWLAERPIPRIYRRASFHAISSSTRDDLVARGVSAERIRVIYPGVDAAWYAPDTGVGRDTVPTFLYVGRLKRYKGVDAAIRAIALLGREGVSCRLVIAGQGDDRPRLEALAARVAPGDRVRFLGFVTTEDKRALLRRAWAVVFPSAKEGWGITNVEAAACGTGAIASDSPGLRESVRHESTGLLVPHGDVRALAAAMRRVVHAPDLVERFGRAARRFAETLSWEAAASQTAMHLDETIRAASAREKGA